MAGGRKALENDILTKTKPVIGSCNGIHNAIGTKTSYSFMQ